mgnify:CR=1 FL=1
MLICKLFQLWNFVSNIILGEMILKFQIVLVQLNKFLMNQTLGMEIIILKILSEALKKKYRMIVSNLVFNLKLIHLFIIKLNISQCNFFLYSTTSGKKLDVCLSKSIRLFYNSFVPILWNNDRQWNNLIILRIIWLVSGYLLHTKYYRALKWVFLKNHFIYDMR